MRIRDGSSVVFSSDLGHLYHSAAIPALENISSPSSFIAPSSFERTFFRRSKLSHTSFQFPLVAALLYSVARDRQSVDKGKSVYVRVDLGVRRTIKKKNNKHR